MQYFFPHISCQLFVEKCLSCRLFIKFLPEKKHLSPAKKIYSATVCILPLLCCTVLKIITARQSTAIFDFNELSLRKQPPSTQVTESESVLFTDGDYVIMSLRTRNVTFLSFSRMFGGSGSQSLHIITASIYSILYYKPAAGTCSD